MVLSSEKLFSRENFTMSSDFPIYDGIEETEIAATRCKTDGTLAVG